jgi:hypothetical protein
MHFLKLGLRREREEKGERRGRKTAEPDQFFVRRRGKGREGGGLANLLDEITWHPDPTTRGLVFDLAIIYSRHP